MRYVVRTLLLGTLMAAVGSDLLAQHGVAAGHIAPPSTPLRGISPGGRPFPVPRNFPAPLGLRAPAAGYTGIRPGALRSRGFNRADYRHVPYTYFLTPYYYPFLDYGNAPLGGEPYDVPAVDPAVQASVMAENALGQQIQRLTAEISELKNSQQYDQQQAQSQQEPEPPPAPPITVILRNGQQLQVQNYAVMNQTFWDFSSQPARRIPISTIDLAASTKATEAQGVEFPHITPQ